MQKQHHVEQGIVSQETLLSIGSKHTYRSNMLGKCCILNYKVRSYSLCILIDPSDMLCLLYTSDILGATPKKKE